jgi:hypothetical protein
MNISYHQIRSATIPLSQYLIDLLTGAWLGSASDRALTIARGEARGFRPREIFEITVHTGQRG